MYPSSAKTSLLMNLLFLGSLALKRSIQNPGNLSSIPFASKKHSPDMLGIYYFAPEDVVME